MQNIQMVDVNGCATILLNDYIGFVEIEGVWRGIDGAQIESLLWMYNESEWVKQINVRINSPGGDVEHGLKIMAGMLNISKPVHTYIDGQAESMAAMIALCGQKRYMSNQAYMMYHYARFADESSNVTESHKIRLRMLNDIFDKHIIARIGKKPSEIFSKNKDEFYTAEEALEYGIVDELFDLPQLVASGLDIRKILAVRTNGEETNDTAVKLHNIYASALKPQKAKAMKVNKILGLQSEASEDSQVESIQSMIDNMDKLKAEKEASDAKIADLQKKIDAFEAEKQASKDTEAESVVADAIEKGFVQESEKTDALALAKANIVAYKKMLSGMIEAGIKPAGASISNAAKQKVTASSWAGKMLEISNKQTI